MLDRESDDLCCVHHTHMIETADEDGVYAYCPECEWDANAPPYRYPCANPDCDAIVKAPEPTSEPVWCPECVPDVRMQEAESVMFHMAFPELCKKGGAA